MINDELRIAFDNVFTHAHSDKADLEKLANGEISMETAIRRISRRNGNILITEAMMKANLVWLGYRKENDD